MRNARKPYYRMSLDRAPKAVRRGLAIVFAMTLAACGAAQRQDARLVAFASSNILKNSARAKNVILFVGDGMGVSTVTAMRILAGQRAGKSGEDHVLPFETFENTALIKTYNSNQQVPDSAGTATSLLSGMKTKAGFIGMGPTAFRGDCQSSKGAEIRTLLEMAAEAGLSTGIVTTARLTHATPAAAYAHSPERGWEADSDMPEIERAAGCRDIARQFVEFTPGGGVDVAFGGGRANFLPASATDPEHAALRGKRADGRDLVEAWRKANSGGLFVWNTRTFGAIDLDAAKKVLGLFEPGHMQFEVERNKDDTGEPSLTDMTRKAIQILSRNEKGYVLLVEGGRIDHAHHAGNALRALTEGVEFARAVGLANNMTSSEDTLIVVTADHSHTFAIAGYPTRGNPIFGKVVGNDERGEPMNGPDKADDGKPYTTLGYYATPGAVDDKPRQDITHIDTAHPDYLQQSAVFLRSGAHGGEDVPAYARGPNADVVRGVMEQQFLFDVMRDALGLRAARAP